ALAGGGDRAAPYRADTGSRPAAPPRGGSRRHRWLECARLDPSGEDSKECDRVSIACLMAVGWNGRVGFLGLVLIGCLVGLTPVLFGVGRGFGTVPLPSLVDADLGSDTARVAAATSALVMLVNAIVATVSTKRSTLAHLKGRWWLLGLLGLGGALGASGGRFAPDALLQWGFVAYIAATAIDLLARPGFFRRRA